MLSVCILFLGFFTSTYQCPDESVSEISDYPTANGRSNNLQEFVDVGFLSWQGESVRYTPFGVVKRKVVGFASKRSPNGILVREETRKFSTNSIVYPDGDGFSEIIGRRYKSRSRCSKRNLPAADDDDKESSRLKSKLVGFLDIRNAQFVCETVADVIDGDGDGILKHWRITKTLSGEAMTEEIKFTTKGQKVRDGGRMKLVPVSYTMTSDHDGVGDGFTVIEVLTFNYAEIPSRMQNEKVRKVINDNSKCIM